MYEDGGFRIADLIMRQGASRAEAAARKFAMIGQGVADLGQNVGGILQARDEQRATSKRAAATAALFSGEGPPDPKRVLAVLGPEHGAKVIDAMGSFQKIQQAQAQQVQLDEKQATEEFGKLAHGFSSLPPEVQAQLYPAVSGLARRSGKFPEMPEEFTPEVASQIGAFGQAWSAGSQKPEGFTLAPGQVRFGPDGQQIAAAPAAPEKPAGPRVVGRSLVDESGKVIYRDPEAPQRADAEPLVAIMGEDGSPVLVPRSQAAGKRPASNREQGRAVTSGDANRLADLDTSLDDIIALESALSGSRATGATARAGAMLPDFVTELTGLGSDAKQKQATIDRVKQVIGKALEEGVLRKEDEEKYKKILPTIGDPPDVAKAKMDGLWDAIQRRRQTQLDALSDAGYDTARFRERAPRERTAPTSPGQPTGARKNPFR